MELPTGCHYLNHQMKNRGLNMDEKYEKLTIELLKILNAESLKFILNILIKNKEENTSDLINLIVSSHLSSMFTTMTEIADNNKLMQKNVDDFFNHVKQFLGTLKIVSSVDDISLKDRN